MTRRSRNKDLIKRDLSCSLRMSTREFALLLAVDESRLHKALTTTMTYQGLTLPAPVNRFSGKTRQFDWNECLDFADRLSNGAADAFEYQSKTKKDLK